MSRVLDPVCGMAIDTDTARARSDYEGRIYYFCSDVCKREFDKDPSLYSSVPKQRIARADAPPSEETFTEGGGMVTPKFGSAGSGGAEFENRPDEDRK